MRAGALILVAAALVATAGCEREFANRNLEQLKLNMTPKEVESIIGNPDRTEKADLELETQRKTMTVIRYFYHHKGQTIVLQFQNGRLMNIPEKLKEN
jgi:murein endopeptidase